MAVDPSLMSVAPNEPECVIPDRLDIGQFEVATVRELDGALVTLTVRAGTEAAK